MTGRSYYICLRSYPSYKLSSWKLLINQYWTIVGLLSTSKLTSHHCATPNHHCHPLSGISYPFWDLLSMAHWAYASYAMFLITYLLNSNLLKNYNRRIEHLNSSSFHQITAYDEMTLVINWEQHLRRFSSYLVQKEHLLGYVSMTDKPSFSTLMVEWPSVYNSCWLLHSNKVARWFL